MQTRGSEELAAEGLLFAQVEPPTLLGTPSPRSHWQDLCCHEKHGKGLSLSPRVTRWPTGSGGGRGEGSRGLDHVIPQSRQRAWGRPTGLCLSHFVALASTPLSRASLPSVTQLMTLPLSRKERAVCKSVRHPGAWRERGPISQGTGPALEADYPGSDPALQLTCHVTLAKSRNLSGAQFPHL